MIDKGMRCHKNKCASLMWRVLIRAAFGDGGEILLGFLTAVEERFFMREFFNFVAQIKLGFRLIFEFG